MAGRVRVDARQVNEMQRARLIDQESPSPQWQIILIEKQKRLRNNSIENNWLGHDKTHIAMA
jgi:hypothetical protein